MWVQEQCSYLFNEPCIKKFRIYKGRLGHEEVKIKNDSWGCNTLNAVDHVEDTDVPKFSIPKKKKSNTPWQILGLSKGATPAKIKKVYKKWY